MNIDMAAMQRLIEVVNSLNRRLLFSLNCENDKITDMVRFRTECCFEKWHARCKRV